MESAYGRLISFNNANNLELIGLLFEPQNQTTQTIAIHVHGNYGNFYNNKFIWYMSKIYTKNDISFLTFNLSAHDGLCEGYRLGVLDYIGGGVADYNESLLDIEAAVGFARQIGYKNIILQGHSLGCDKILDYTINKSCDDFKIVLLSPVDSYAVQTRWLKLHKNETIPQQINRLKQYQNSNDDSLGWLDIDEYGAEGLNADWIYKIPVTQKALLSILEGSAFKYLNLTCGENFISNVPTFVFLGNRDGLQMSTQEEMRLFLMQHFTNCFVDDTLDSDHDIIGVEEILTERIVHWIKKS